MQYFCRRGNRGTGRVDIIHKDKPLAEDVVVPRLGNGKDTANIFLARLCAETHLRAGAFDAHQRCRQKRPSGSLRQMTRQLCSLVEFAREHAASMQRYRQDGVTPLHHPVTGA